MKRKGKGEGEGEGEKKVGKVVNMNFSLTFKKDIGRFFLFVRKNLDKNIFLFLSLSHQIG